MKIKKILLEACILMLAFCSISSASVPALSGGAEFVHGRWTDLAARFPIPGVDGKIKDAPSPEILASWWSVFNDETLTVLIMTALENNRSLASARASITEGRAQLGVSRAAGLPWLDSENYWRVSKNVSDTGEKCIDIARLSIDTSWEIDIFGGRRQTIKAGAADLEAQYAALNSAWVSLTSEIAIDYISLRALQEQLAIARENLGAQRQTLDIIETRFKRGLDDALALEQSKYTLEQTLSSIPPLETGAERMKNSLAILAGMVPGALEETLSTPKPIPEVSADVIVGIPANAMRQRPDIREAELNLAAQIARKKAAKADLWPKFFLDGSIGTETRSPVGGSLFEGPNNLYSFGPRITFPIFHWGAIRNNIKVQTAKQEQCLYAYEQAVLTAAVEVRNAITSVLKERLRTDSLGKGITSAKSALTIAEDKYSRGLVDFNNVISAQQALLSMKKDHAESRGQTAIDMVALFKSLGGGWALMDAQSK